MEQDIGQNRSEETSDSSRQRALSESSLDSRLSEIKVDEPYDDGEDQGFGDDDNEVDVGDEEDPRILRKRSGRKWRMLQSKMRPPLASLPSEEERAASVTVESLMLMKLRRSESSQVSLLEHRETRGVE
jgi:hypothetical protein